MCGGSGPGDVHGPRRVREASSSWCPRGRRCCGGAGEYVDYAASKAAVDTVVAGLAAEVVDEGIRVVGVRPGVIATDIHEPGRVERVAPELPMKRPGTADEVAAAIALAGVTGVVVRHGHAARRRRRPLAALGSARRRFRPLPCADPRFVRHHGRMPVERPWDEEAAGMPDPLANLRHRGVSPYGPLA